MSASPIFPKLPPGWFENVFKLQEGQISVRAYFSGRFSSSPDQNGLKFEQENQSSSASQGNLKFLFLVHGQGEQSGRYEHFAHYLNGLVDAIFCMDLPGHGLSQGPRGHIEKFEDYHRPTLAAFQFAQNLMAKINPRSEAHWFGHSMGGLISLGVHFENGDLKMKSVTISAPLLEIAVPVPPLKKFFGELVEPILGRLKLKNELDGSLVSHDPSVAEAYDKDPLNHGYVTPRFFVQLTKEMKRIREMKAEFPYSLMVIVPLEDKVVSAAETLKFYQGLKIKNGCKKYLCSLPNYYHESFNDFGKERAFNALADWIHG